MKIRSSVGPCLYAIWVSLLALSAPIYAQPLPDDPERESRQAQAQDQGALQRSAELGLRDLLSLIELVEGDDRAGVGSIEAQTLAAARAARAEAPSRWQSWGLNAQGQAPQSAQAGAGEQQVTLSVSVALGDGPARQARALELGAQRVEVRSLLRRGQRVGETLSALSALWVARETLSRRAQLVETLQQLASPLLSSGALSALDQLDLSLALEDARLQFKRAEVELESRYELLRSLLSAPLIEVFKASPERLNFFGVSPPLSAPWGPMMGSLASLPELLHIHQQASLLEARAEASGAAYPWSLTLGGGVNMVGAERWGMGTLSLSAPLSTPAEAEGARLKLEASATRAEHAWLTQRLKARLEARVRRWSSDRARLELLHAHSERLRARERLTMAAAQARHVPLTRALSALTETVEGELEWASLSAALWSEVADATVSLRSTHPTSGAQP